MATRTEYEAEPKKCKNCKATILFEKRRSVFCNLSCSSTYNNYAHMAPIKAEYALSPAVCKQCGVELLFEKRENSFCDTSCAGFYNSPGRVQSDETKRQIARTLTGRTLTAEHVANFSGTKNGRYKGFHPLYPVTCPICGVEKLFRRPDHKTCGKEECRVAAINTPKAKSSRRKHYWYFNPNEDKDIRFDSSWEVRTADLLIERDIVWVRPDKIDWVDSTGKARQYYADFYLPDYDLYLDPKNPWIMGRDEEKMAAVSLMVHVEYGHIDKILKIVEDLTQINRRLEKSSIS